MTLSILSKYGRWEIISLPYDCASRSGRSIGTYYLCRCECGTVKPVVIDNLVSGASQSCGCMHKEIVTRHGQWRSKLYKVWTAMKGRCHNVTDTGYDNYGGRGIYVCQSWREDFVLFMEWASLNGYQEGLHIDRIDNDGPYSPDNCEWVTPEANQSHKRNTVWLTAFGERKGLTAWSRDPRCVVPWNALYFRIQELHMDPEEALTTPSNKTGRSRVDPARSILLTAFGETKILADWVRDPRCPVKATTLRNRIKNLKWETVRALTTPAADWNRGG